MDAVCFNAPAAQCQTLPKVRRLCLTDEGAEFLPLTRLQYQKTASLWPISNIAEVRGVASGTRWSQPSKCQKQIRACFDLCARVQKNDAARRWSLIRAEKAPEPCGSKQPKTGLIGWVTFGRKANTYTLAAIGQDTGHLSKCGADASKSDAASASSSLSKHIGL